MTTTLGDWLSEAPFSLALSSGFFGFFAHTGVALALEERDLRAAALSGSSAGALVGSALAAGLSARELSAELRSLRRAEFWDPALGPGLLRGRRFRGRLEVLLPVGRFEDCARPLAVSTFDVGSRRTHVLSSGELVPAVVASCAVPVMFWPVRHEGRVLYDGGIADRPGLAGLSPEGPGARVLHHHLASRSPWRRRGDPALDPPRRGGLVALVIPDLPRSGPHALDAGVRAMSLALERTRRALDAPVSDVILAGPGDR